MMDAATEAKDLIRYDSTSANTNREITDHLVERIRSLGMSVTVQELAGPSGPKKFNVLGIRPGDEDPSHPGLLLAGHMDTVPVSPGDKANLEPRVERGRMFGRGACDMKGAIAAMLCAVDRFQSVPLANPLHLAFTCDEEIGMHGARALQREGIPRARYAIVGEPTGLIPVVKHKAYALARLTLTGRPCHSSRPDLGVSALKAAARAILALEALETTLSASSDVSEGPPFDPPYTTLNVGQLSAGSAPNVVPGTATLVIELRPVPNNPIDTLLDRLKTILRRTAEAEGVKYKLELERRHDGMAARKNSILTDYLEIITGELRQATAFGTEGPIYQAMGMDTVILGPGHVEQAHKRDEFILVSELNRAVDTYAAAIQRFCGM